MSEVIAALINALGDENWLIRTNAASVLENLKQATPEVIAALINALGDEEECQGKYRLCAGEFKTSDA